MKICKRCNKSKEFKDFAKARRSKDGLHCWCKECSNKARMDSYYKNPQIQRDLGKKFCLRNKEFINNYKKDHPCVDCGFTDIRALQFDHLRDKEMEISIMVRKASIERLSVEIAKCEVRCANCHAIITSIRCEGN